VKKVTKASSSPAASVTAPVTTSLAVRTRPRRGDAAKVRIVPVPYSAVVAPDQPFEVRSLPCGHSPFVTRPVELATTLASIALQRLT